MVRSTVTEKGVYGRRSEWIVGVRLTIVYPHSPLHAGGGLAARVPNKIKLSEVLSDSARPQYTLSQPNSGHLPLIS